SPLAHSPAISTHIFLSLIPAPPCSPLFPYTTLFRSLGREMKKAGKSVSNHLCEHFPRSRQELYHLVRLHRIRGFDELIAKHGRRSEEHTSELQSRGHLVCRLLLEKKNDGANDVEALS